ncbi:LysR family transcriptional regulator [Pseudoalteromonas xiamenensis]|uniref:LysR family transcriptional regulator n=1 Tax=Pseudoalteromonas xiamenensis TaxID=882626 RepID=A0A975DE97_9GAMM|nr:LysR family transcriptional regulator [Pseudoalteromonas xiamenensis]QTH70203.1 LysR family transcriptional regulator [Pseudoalteromonas xiamenensis]
MWQDIEIFLAIVEHGTLSRAAEALDCSTSFISRHLKQMESRLGTALFQRSTRNVKLTAAGAEYAKRLKAISLELQNATALLQGAQQEIKGPIRITGAGDFVSNQVSPVLALFAKAHPEVSIELDFNNRNVDLIEEGFDLAIRFGRLQDSSLIARKLSDRVMTLVATPEYIASHPQLNHPDDLLEHECLVAINPKWRFVENNEPFEVKVAGRWRSNHPQAILHACLNSVGIAHLAQDIAGSYVANGQLHYLLEEYQIKDNASWLVYPRKDFMPYRVKCLIDFLLAHFNPS